MATNIKRTLYVGLGGTGMNALLHTKKMFIETYGEVPPMIGFVGLDTDHAAYAKSLKTKYGEVKLEPREQISLIEVNPKPIFLRNRDRLSWITDSSSEALTKLTDGAGMVRTNGRFAFAMKYKSVEAKIKQTLNEICSAEIARNSKYQLLDTSVDINLVFSIAGGTGSGTFIDTAYLIKNIKRQLSLRGKTIGYAVLPDIFDAQLKYDKFLLKPNAYGALMDLDFLMHLPVGETIPLDYPGVDGLTGEDAPFNAVFFISNRNDNGDSYDNIDQIAEMVSLALITGAGELSDKAASIADNAERNMISTTYNIGDKKAWASGVGMSEIVFRASDLSEIYGLKTCRRIIERLRNAGNNPEAIAANWIDNPEVKVRENNGRDDIIDWILPKEPDFILPDINDRDNPKSEIDNYKKEVSAGNSFIDKRVSDKCSVIEEKLHQLIVDTLNGDYGIGLTKAVIAALKDHAEICLKEMKTELDGFLRMSTPLDVAVTNAISELASLRNKIFKRQSTVDDATADLCAAVVRTVVNQREIQRRNGAIVFYTWFAQQLDNWNKKIDAVDTILSNLYTRYGRRIAEVDDLIRRQSSTFRIDLTAPYIDKVVVDDTEINIPAFIKSMGWADGILEFPNKPMLEIERNFKDYTSSLNGTQHWLSCDVEYALRQLSDEDFRRVLNLAIAQSSQLFPTDFHGYTHEDVPNYFFVGVPDKDHTCLKGGAIELRDLTPNSTDPDFASVGGTDRIIIYRQYCVVPVFTLLSVPEYKRTYDAWNSRPLAFSNHFDENIRRRMVREQFSLMPTEKNSSDMIELWVNGLIFGLIKNEDGIYSFKDEENGDPLDDYWTPLAKDRAEAFDLLRRSRDKVEESFEKYISKIRTSRGVDEFNAIISDAKVNYREKYSQNDLSTADLKLRINKETADLLRNELKYVKDKLGENV